MRSDVPLRGDPTGAVGRLAEHNCFGCTPGNPKGLGLALEEGETEVTASVCLGADYESFPGVIHGGIVATILDEIMGRAVLCAHHRLSVTAGIRIRFADVMRTGTTYVARAAVASDVDSIVKVHARVEQSQTGLVAAAEGTFVLLTHQRLMGKVR